jgi:uroporphyrinogen-III synthase
VYYSPAEIRSLLHNFPSFEQSETMIACFGPATAKAAKEAKLRIDIQAPSAQFPSMTMAIEHHIKELLKANAKNGKLVE